MGGRITTNRRWLIASELAFDDRPWFESLVCRKDYQWLLCNWQEGRLQEFRIFMQILCRRTYALASDSQV